MTGEGEKDHIAPWLLISALVYFPLGKSSWLLRPRGFLRYPNLFTLPCLWDLLSRADWLMSKEKTVALCIILLPNIAIKTPAWKKRGDYCCIPRQAAIFSETQCQDLFPIPSFLTSGTWKTNIQSIHLTSISSLLTYKCLVAPRRDLSSYLFCVDDI